MQRAAASDVVLLDLIAATVDVAHKEVLAVVMVMDVAVQASIAVRWAVVPLIQSAVQLIVAAQDRPAAIAAAALKSYI